MPQEERVRILLAEQARLLCACRCEDIYAGLVSVQADMTWRRMMVRGAQLPLKTKLLSGVTPVLLLVSTLVRLIYIYR